MTIINKKKIRKYLNALSGTLEPLNVYRNIAERYINRLNRKEFENPPFKVFNERPVEYRFVFEQITSIYPKEILDVGTGVTALPHLMANCGCRVTAIDNVHDYWTKGLFNRHHHVINSDITKRGITSEFDFITCISTLEHIEKYEEAVKNMFSLLKSGGHLVLTFPYTEKTFTDNVYVRPESNAYGKQLPFKTHSFSAQELKRWAENNGAETVKQEYWQFFSGEFWTAGKRLMPPKQVTKDDLHQLSCILMKKE